MWLSRAHATVRVTCSPSQNGLYPQLSHGMYGLSLGLDLQKLELCPARKFLWYKRSEAAELSDCRLMIVFALPDLSPLLPPLSEGNTTIPIRELDGMVATSSCARLLRKGKVPSFHSFLLRDPERSTTSTMSVWEQAGGGEGGGGEGDGGGGEGGEGGGGLALA